MSYTPTEWKTGDVVTSAKLNNLEQGVADAVLSYEPTNWKTGDVVTAAKLNKLENGVAVAPTVTTFFDDDVTFTAVTTQWGTNYEAEVQLASVPIEFPTYDPDYNGFEDNVFIISIEGATRYKDVGRMSADLDATLMYVGWGFSVLVNGSEENVQANLYSDGTLTLKAFADWALSNPHFTLQAVNI